MHHGRRFRLTPPWPPGLETIRKALLGPVRHRTVTADNPATHVYDDAVLIALALNAFFERRAEGFRLNTAALQMQCRVEAAGQAGALAEVLQRLARDQASAPVVASACCCDCSIEITAQVDGIALRHRAWIARPGQRAGLRWNPSVVTALKTLRARTAVIGASAVAPNR